MAGGVFSADDVLDWFAELEAGTDDEVTDALGEAVRQPGPVGLAAAVLVAHGCVRAVRTGQPEIDAWLVAHRPRVDRALADAALAAVDAGDPGLLATLPVTCPPEQLRQALSAGPSREVI